MARTTLHLLYIAALVLAMMLAGLSPVQSNPSDKQSRLRPVADRDYRSPTSNHKVIVAERDRETRDRIIAEGGTLIEDYGAFSLLSAPADTAKSISRQADSSSPIRDDMNLILLRAAILDTMSNELRARHADDQQEETGGLLRLVQMVGPVKQEWLDELRSVAEVVTYVPNNAYLIRADAEAFDRIREIESSPGGFIQWAGEFKPGYKIAPETALNSAGEIVVTVQLLKGEQADVNEIASTYSATVLDEPVNVLNYTNVKMKVSPERLAELARRNDVVWIEPASVPELFDERQNLIVAGSFVGSQLGRPGYLAWLKSKGLASTPDFMVDISDTGIDRGVLDPEVLHKDFLNPAGLSRIIYARQFGTYVEGPPNDLAGHGTINAAIVGGYNVEAGFPHTDAEGYSFGLGVHPFVKLGVSKIFNPDWSSPNFAVMADAMYRDGTRISSNSWGAYDNNYTTDCQLYDHLVRDARSTIQGNQELTILFASGNKGIESLSTPGTAKNIITVGASENLRPGFDGCNIPSEGADDLYSLIDFSSRGLTTDGRTKPEIVAPGTHIQGASSQDQSYTGGGICGPKNFPSGQTLYTWSSGTSHSTPAVAGAAALVRQFFQQSTGQAPSPAMIKAFLTNSTMYMTGNLTGGNLPGPDQGWGLVNLGRALDDVPRMTIDQEQVISNTGQVVTLRGRIADASQPFRVTLAWTDAPGSPVGSAAVNDLDLQVEVGGKTYLGNRLTGAVSVEGGPPDKLNNLEAVWAPEGAAGDFVIRIVGSNIAGDAIPGNGDSTDQDFALVVYNAQAPGSGGGGSTDSPPRVTLKFPAGGETLMVGNLVRIAWEASDDKQIQSQRVDFSSDGETFNPIAVLDGKSRSFDWRIPSLPTPFGKIKVTALDGINLPVSSANLASFEIIQGPPDTTAPSLALLSPSGDSIIGGGTTTTFKWRESDNVGVIQRVIELSTDGGLTFQHIITLVAPSSGEQQNYDWQVPVALATQRGKIRLTIYDGAGNSATLTSTGKFEVWPLPIVTDVDFNFADNNKDQLEVNGRNFRLNETDIYVDGKKLKKIKMSTDNCNSGSGICKRVYSTDKKLNKIIPSRTDVNIQVQLNKTGQFSPGFNFKRKRESVSN